MNYYVGIDVGGTNIAIGVVNQDGQLILKHSIPTKAPREAEWLVDDMAKHIFILSEMANVDVTEIAGVGIGVPSPIHPVTFHMQHAYNLQLIDVDFLGLLRNHFPQAQLSIENDADCAVYGEYLCGAGKGYNHVFMFTLGTGLGSGIILNNKLFRGGTGYGVEPGHITIDDSGRDCICGKRGCLEAYVCIRGLRESVYEVLGDKPNALWLVEAERDGVERFDAKTVFAAAADRDEAALRVVDAYAHNVAIGISNALVSYRPDVVLIGGGIGQAGDVLFEPVRQKVYARITMSDGIPEVPIYPCSMGNDAGIVGAALLSRDEPRFKIQ